MKMFAFGKCSKKDGWVVSLYQRVGDRYAMLKVKKLESSTMRLETSKQPLSQH